MVQVSLVTNLDGSDSQPSYFCCCSWCRSTKCTSPSSLFFETGASEERVSERLSGPAKRGLPPALSAAGELIGDAKDNLQAAEDAFQTLATSWGSLMNLAQGMSAPGRCLVSFQPYLFINSLSWFSRLTAHMHRTNPCNAVYSSFHVRCFVWYDAGAEDTAYPLRNSSFSRRRRIYPLHHRGPGSRNHARGHNPGSACAMPVGGAVRLE